jgi:flagellar hook-associated protein 3 FlgL
MQDLQAQFRNAAEGLNSRYGGKYLFAGGQIDTMPMSATSMSDLTAPATVISDFFHNDRFVTQSKVDESTLVDTGVLADDVGTNMMGAFKTIQAYEQSGAGPFQGTLTDAQRTFLEGQLATWDQVHEDVTQIAGRNGLVQRRVDSVKADLVSRQSTLKGMMGEITDADMAEAASKLQAAQISVQAAAQVFLSLQNSSLLALLNNG